MTRIAHKNTEKIELSAHGKKLGRFASEVASLLLGKHSVVFKRHINEGAVVVVKDAGKLAISAKKFGDKKYVRYSGFPGGLRHERAEEVAFKKGRGELLRRAVYGMLPANKLRKERMKNLIINE